MKYLKRFETVPKEDIYKLQYVECAGRAVAEGRAVGEITIVGRHVKKPSFMSHSDDFIAVAVIKMIKTVNLNRTWWAGFIISPVEIQRPFKFLGQPNEKWEEYDNPTPEQIEKYKKISVQHRFDL